MKSSFNHGKNAKLYVENSENMRTVSQCEQHTRCNKQDLLETKLENFVKYVKFFKRSLRNISRIISHAYPIEQIIQYRRSRIFAVTNIKELFQVTIAPLSELTDFPSEIKLGE
jgi:hypothetical protein